MMKIFIFVLVITLTVLCLPGCAWFDSKPLSFIDTPSLELEPQPSLDLVGPQSIVFVHNPENNTYALSEEDAKKLLETLDDVQLWMETERQYNTSYKTFYTE